MTDEKQGKTAWNIAVAKDFYTAHELAFVRAASEAKAEARHFSFTAEQFDDWAVAAGHMPKTVRAAGSTIEGDGLAQMRNRLRARLNRASRRGESIPRAFSVEARGGRWRVLLAERYVMEKPREDVDGLWKAYEHVGRNVESIKKQICSLDHLDDQERFVALAHLEYVTSFIFWGIQQVQTVKHRIDPNAQNPDMRKLGREMGKLVSQAFHPKPSRRKAKAAQMQMLGA
jgi:hypothetical protein